MLTCLYKAHTSKVPKPKRMPTPVRATLANSKLHDKDYRPVVDAW